MRRLRLIVYISGLFVIAILCFLCAGRISGAELLKGAILGAVVSIIVSVPFEIINYSHTQNQKLNDFFWQGIASYSNDLCEVFLYARDFCFLEQAIFEREGISIKNEEWKDYIEIYNNYKEILEPKIDGFKREVISFTDKHSDKCAFCSHLLSNIEQKDFLGRKSKRYNKCYMVYRIIENIDWSMCEIRPVMNKIMEIENSTEQACRFIVVFRWLSNTLVKEYDRNICDLTPEEIEKVNQQEIVLAKKDLNLAIHELLKEL